MSSAADMLEVGCPDPTPVLERMLSTRSCCASACHCSAPAVSLLICCVTTYLLGTTPRTNLIFSYPAPVIQKLRLARPIMLGQAGDPGKEPRHKVIAVALRVSPRSRKFW